MQCHIAKCKLYPIWLTSLQNTSFQYQSFSTSFLSNISLLYFEYISSFSKVKTIQENNIKILANLGGNILIFMKSTVSHNAECNFKFYIH